MLNGLSEIPAKRMAALVAVSAGLILGAAVAATSAGAAGAPTPQAGGCPFSVPFHEAHAGLFSPAGCL